MNGAKVAGETGINNNVLKCPQGVAGASVRRLWRKEFYLLCHLLRLDLVSYRGIRRFGKDPIGGLNLTRRRGSLTRASDAASCKLISVLEGGYDVREIARGWATSLNLQLLGAAPRTTCGGARRRSSPNCRRASPGARSSRVATRTTT